MSAPLHLDLLKDEERLSSSPIRLHFMLPMLSSCLALCLAVWWLLLCVHTHSQIQLRQELLQTIATLTPVHASVLASRAQEEEALAVVRQLTLYKNSHIRFGTALSNLTERVPENIQFAELCIPTPQPPPTDPQHPATAPTNTTEQVSMRIAGRTAGERSSESVDTLLATLRSPAFTNLFRTAVIPKGAFRQDIIRDPNNRDTLLFEISCECTPRRFE